ncbi:MAG TPA: DUF2188 domain-containing protein [Xanthobacteraceae bacterium]|nr:DUF2188 domain-containing protein [Xanthobacteraceae bacterium]
MGSATYRIVHARDDWSIEHDGAMTGVYATKEAAFEAAAIAASNAIKEGHGITITVPGADETGEPALGAR